jgi:endonuclease-3
MDIQQRAYAILKILRLKYKRRPDDFVHWCTPLELLVATVLSAQCTDKRVNMVTRNLFKKYKKARDYMEARSSVLEKEIRSTGFYKSKTKYLKGIGKMLVAKFNGKVPADFNELLHLPGVSRKTANLIMAKLHGQSLGIAVDTHVTRLSYRMGLTKNKLQNKIENDLNKLFKPADYLDVTEFMILHGRAICKARQPKCLVCPVAHLCPKIGTEYE